ncbi:hypothetical protein [Nocardia abscessus]|uniref:hypothetical protein n=1 Tax=Nocardia abscessus TaxID=120957 RepID=UPI00245657D0|nr:hypothetical protein [Nocardia abscessus]
MRRDAAARSIACVHHPAETTTPAGSISGHNVKPHAAAKPAAHTDSKHPIPSTFGATRARRWSRSTCAGGG